MYPQNTTFINNLADFKPPLNSTSVYLVYSHSSRTLCLWRDQKLSLMIVASFAIVYSLFVFDDSVNFLRCIRYHQGQLVFGETKGGPS